MANLNLVSGGGLKTKTVARPALEKKLRGIRSVVTVMACDGGEAFCDVLTSETRGDLLELLEALTDDAIGLAQA